MSLEFSQNTYQPPVNLDLVSMVVIESASHLGPFEGAIDFAVPVGTEVYASLDGTVINVTDTHDLYGNDPKFGPYVNFVALQHVNDEYSEYLHLGHSAAEVEIGQKVKAGQLLGRTGLSGWMTEPHLHWTVFKKVKTDFGSQCLRIKTSVPILEKRH